MLALAAGAVAVPGNPGVATAAPEGASGCGYGTEGPFADTLCWIDMSAFDPVLAGGAGQAMSVSLPGGYDIDFVVRTSGDRAIAPSRFPTWTIGAGEGAPVGNRIYLGTPGQPALYQSYTGVGTTTTIELDDILVTDSDGNPVDGWRLVGVDAEATDASESITFASDTPVSVLATYDRDGAATNGCQANITQVDANTVRCTGGVGIPYGTVVVGTTAPTSFAQTMTVGDGSANEGVAFGIQTSSISLDVVVEDRAAPSDSFEASVVSPEDQVVGSATTGTSDAASTGVLTVLPRLDGSSYTLQQVGEGGTDLSRYTRTWACSRDGVPDPSLSASGVDSIVVSPDAGEAIACTVTDDADPDEPPGPPGPPGPGPGPGPGPVPATPSFTG